MEAKAARSAEAGFTLIEMMVALAIFSLAALALVRLQAFELRSAGRVEAHTIGGIVAHNLAAEALSDPAAPALGLTQGTLTNAGRRWAWTRIVSRTDDVRLLRVDILVESQSGAPVRLAFVRPVTL